VTAQMVGVLQAKPANALAERLKRWRAAAGHKAMRTMGFSSRDTLLDAAGPMTMPGCVSTCQRHGIGFNS
jgi:hypothetical protein